MKNLILFLILFVNACKSEKPTFNKIKIVQQCLDTLNKIPDLKYMDTSTVVLLQNDIIKDPMSLTWGKNKIKLEQEFNEKRKFDTATSQPNSKIRRLIINKIAYTDTHAEVQVVFLDVQANYIFYFMKNKTDSVYKIKEIGEVDL